MGYSGKASPAKIDKLIFIFPDSVVPEQWPYTPKAANPPQNLALLNPGECIRVGIIATGDGRDTFLESTQLSFRVDFAGQSQDHPLAPLAAVKRIKPEGGDLVDEALIYAGVQPPDMSMASLGASAANWCVSDDAQDGTAKITAEAETPNGHMELTQAKIQIESFEAGSKRTFKDDDEFEKFTMGYHDQPNPARLFPVLLFFSSDTRYRAQTGSLETLSAFLGAALKADPAAAQDFMKRVAAQSGFTRSFGLLVLLDAGYDISSVLKSMSEEDQQKFANHPVFPDPFDFTHVEDIGTRLDMLWSIFTATGQFAPIEKIANALAWHADWVEFDKARKSSSPPKEWTPSIGRAAGYGAAGWSLGSFQRTDPLAADYIEFMIASPDTPEEVKAELKALGMNPAFRWTGRN